MSGRTLLIILLALVCGVSAAIGVSQVRGRVAAQATEDTVAVAVASADLARGSVVTADRVRMRSWPRDLLPEGALTNPEACYDRTVMVPIAGGELLLDSKLAAKGTGAGLAALVPKDMRAYTVHTPTISSGVAGFILPGNHIDVLLTVSTPGSRDPSGGATTTTLLQNVEILAVDQRLDAPSENRVDPKELRSVTLLVTPDQAAKLSLAQTRGTLHLSLRNQEDIDAAETQPITLADLQFRQEPPLAPPTPEPEKTELAEKETAPPPPPPIQIRTLRGLQRGKVLLSDKGTAAYGP